MPEDFRNRILRIAVETDVVAQYRDIEKWRVTAICCARWLLRAAVSNDQIPPQLPTVVREIQELARQMNASDTGEFAIKKDFDLK